MDIRTAPKKVDDSTGFSFLGVDDNELIKINPNDLIKTTSTYAQIKNNISELETALESESENRGSAVRAEKEAREAADNTLQTNINAEVTRAKNAESDLNTTISNEVTRAKNAESSLSTTISDEVTRAESALNTTISNEVTRAKKAESDLSSSIQTSISSHNTSTTAHDDIRTLINNLTTRINAVADSEDVDLDQLSEIVAYIKSNRSLIDNVTTSKVSVSDIIDNLTSTSANKPLSANQGRVLNTSITSLTTKLNNHVDSLSNVENKSSETIRSEITKKNVIDALGYTPGTSSSEPITYTLSKSGSKIILTSSEGTETSVTDSDTNTIYSAGTGITLSGTTFSNAGVRSISSGSTNGTISVNTNGTSAEVAVKGLGSAAYTASSAYAAASHTHTKSQISDFPTSLPANGGNADTVDGEHASAFATANHTHEIADVTELQNTLDSKLDKFTSAGGGIATRSGGGKYKYLKIATIVINAEYINRPIVFEMSGRGRGLSLVTIEFNSLAGTDPGLSFFNSNCDNCFWIKKTATSTWEVYGEYNEPWGDYTLHRIIDCGTEGNRVDITVIMANIDSLPSGCIQVSYGGNANYANSAGNAATATKLATARTVSLTGSVTGSGSFDGSGNLSITTSTNHTHNYAGSSSAGGPATSAVKLDTSSAGSATQPVYFSGGKPVACTYTLGKSVPSNAVFTDTNTWRGIQDNLTSTSTTDSLSAKQGKVLNEKFGTTLTSTLSAGSTSLIFSNSVITTSSTIDLYTDKYGVNPTNVVVETGKMTLTFDTQSSAISVKAVIK